MQDALNKVSTAAKEALNKVIAQLSAADNSLNVSLASIASLAAQHTDSESLSGGDTKSAELKREAAKQASLLSRETEQQVAAAARSHKFGLVAQLAKVAEEAATQGASASAFCATASPGWVDTEHVKAYAEAAQQEAKKAAMALELLDQFVLLEADRNPEVEDWLSKIRKIASQAAESANTTAVECADRASKMPASKGAMKMMGTRIPCRWFGQGYCMKGSACDFSHDKDDFREVPLVMKYDDRECAFFLRGECARGKTCKWPHGAEELAEVRRLKGVYQRKVGRDRFQPREEDRSDADRRKSPPRAPKRRREEILARRPPRKAPSPGRVSSDPAISGAGL